MRRRAADVKRRKWVMASCDGAQGAGVAPATALRAGLSDEDVAFPTNTLEAALVAFTSPSGLWLLFGRRVAPAGGDAASKIPYTGLPRRVAVHVGACVGAGEPGARAPGPQHGRRVPYARRAVAPPEP